MEEADQLCDRVAIMDHGRILALDTPAELKQSVGADTIVTVEARRATPRRWRTCSQRERRRASTRTRAVDGGVELHVRGAERLLCRGSSTPPRRPGFDVADLSVAEPSLETVFINLTGKELRD